MFLIVACFSLSELKSVQVGTILRYAHANKIEAFVEPALSLCLVLLIRDHADTEKHVSGAGSTIDLVGNIQDFVMFVGSQNLAKAEEAAEAAALLSEVRAAGHKARPLMI